MNDHQQRLDRCFAEIADILLHTDWESLQPEQYMESVNNRRYHVGVSYGLLLVRRLLARFENKAALI